MQYSSHAIPKRQIPSWVEFSVPDEERAGRPHDIPRREPLEVRHLEHDCGLTVFQYACQLGCEGIVSKRLGSRYRSGRSPDWLKFKNPNAPAVRREAEEDWGDERATPAAGTERW